MDDEFIDDVKRDVQGRGEGTAREHAPPKPHKKTCGRLRLLQSVLGGDRDENEGRR